MVLLISIEFILGKTFEMYSKYIVCKIANWHFEANDISYVKDCADGGTRSVAGSYDSVSGDFKLVTEIKDCSRHDKVTNGTHIAEGNFTIANSIFEPMANVDATITSDLTVTSEQDSAEFNCTKTINGTYDMATNTLDGSIKSDCTHNGKVTIPILDLFSGEDSDEEMDNNDEYESQNNENPNNEEYEYPDGNEINDEITQCFNPEMMDENNQGDQGNNDDHPYNQGNNDDYPNNQGNNNDYPNNQGNNDDYPNNQGNNDDYPNNQGNNDDQPWDEEPVNDENDDEENEPNFTALPINL